MQSDKTSHALEPVVTLVVWLDVRTVVIFFLWLTS